MFRTERNLLLSLGLFSLGCLFLPFLSAEVRAEQPNVLIIYADDIGRGDLGLWGQENFATPNIDQLAKEGMRFDRFYGCTVCAPARASLLTGNTNAHSPIPIMPEVWKFSVP